MERWSTEDFQGSETTLYDTIMVYTCHRTFVKTRGMYNTKSERQCKLWTMGDCDESV